MDHSSPGGVVSMKTLWYLAKIDTATISNAIEQFEVRPKVDGFMSRDIKCLFPELGPMVGYAITAKVDTTSPLNEKEVFGGGLLELYEAVNSSPNPVVITLQDVSSKPKHSCHFGDVMATITQKLGAIGVVTNGGVRDIDEVRNKLKFHYFAAGTVASHGNFRITEVNNPISIGEITINPGDLLHGDVNGVITIPKKIVSKVYKKAKEFLRHEEKKKMEVIQSDSPIKKLREIHKEERDLE